MRHVELARLAPDPAWLARAAKLAEDVEAHATAGTLPAMRKNWVKHWSGLRSAMYRLVGRKCWYCESPINSSRPHVDHFRPKSRVSEDLSHDGYYWLAYEWSNYRLSCEFCNSSTDDAPSGRRTTKVDHFPLLNPQSRAKTPVDAIEYEQPVLLDPSDAGDCAHLDFDAMGRARRSILIPHSPAEIAAGECRAEKSIEIYGLDRPGLENSRRIVMNNITVLLEGLEVLPNLGDMLERHIAPSGEYSSAAVAAVMTQRGQSAAVDEIIARIAAAPQYSRHAAPQATVVTLSDLMRNNLVNAGSVLAAKARAGEVTATVWHDGRLRYGVRVDTFERITSLASGGTASDGWTFWAHVVDDRRILLSDIRDEYNMMNMRGRDQDVP